jgi:NAD(P)-dependent dehydrogenase (short-subunit alcohol dehydrogenase family)
MDNFFSLKGKTILVTGASSGIGKSVAILCSRLGAVVYITARKEQRLQQTLAEMQGEEKHYIVADLTRIDHIDSLVEQLPKLDGVVNCAGTDSNVLTKSITQDEIDRVMKPNFEAPVLLQTSLLTNKKINKGASIVFIASMAAQSPTIGNSLYSASKGALISYAKCIGLELAPRKITVNCISPAMVWTELITKGSIELEQLKEDEKRYPLGRYGQPEDIAGLVAYLLSNQNNWMTGSNIEITGGVKSL